VAYPRISFWGYNSTGGAGVSDYIFSVLGLAVTTLKRRRIRGDLIETFKILSGKDNVDSETFFQLADSSRHTRGHSLKLYKRHCRLDAGKFFSRRVVNSWNSLPQHVIEAPSVNSFKKRLDDYYQDMGLF